MLPSCHPTSLATHSFLFSALGFLISSESALYFELSTLTCPNSAVHPPPVSTSFIALSPNKTLKLIIRLRSEDRGTPVAVSLKGGSIELMEQVLTIEGHDFHLIVPRDVEAVMEMYIQAGASSTPSFVSSK